MSTGSNGSSNSLTRLIEQLTYLPGVGEKTANRLAMAILRAPGDFAFSLGRSIQEAKNRIGFCHLCQDLTETDMCRICRNDQRDHSQLCVVEGSASMQALEKTGQYNGVYHILHGNLSPLQSIGPEELGLSRLKDRIRKDSLIAEVILALNTDPEGEATALYLKEYLQDLPIRVTRLAKGVPVGGHVEYIDPMTLSQALASRHDMIES